MKKAILFTAICSLTAVLTSTLLDNVAPQMITKTVEAQACCYPPVLAWPDNVRWPKGAVVHVKIQAGVFDDVEINGIEDSFRAWNARSDANCSNVTYPEPYEFVDTPPPVNDNNYYVKYIGDYTAPQPGITGAAGSSGIVNYAQTTLY